MFRNSVGAGNGGMPEHHNLSYPQDLHIHTIFSDQDSSVVPEQTPELVARIGHAKVMGISDHFEHFADTAYDIYVERMRSLNLLAGTEVDGAAAVDFATNLAFDYYIYHCRDDAADYAGAERLLSTGRPVIIAHPVIERLIADRQRLQGEHLAALLRADSDAVRD